MELTYTSIEGKSRRYYIAIAVLAAIALAASMGVLLFNATLLFGSKGGPGILAFCKVLLWLSFLIIATALGLCITSMSGSL